jgi:metal-responsive CopG/Arc/MetJ family transcriptional regulator
MKTAVSVPDDVFAGAERLARRAGRSRSDVYSAALREYVARHDPELVTEALDTVINALDDDARRDEFVEAAALETMAATEW